jgi:hypothetical protein
MNSARNTATVARSAKHADTQNEPMKTYPMVSFRCDTDLLRQIRREAKRRDMNTSEFIKEAVTFHLHNLADQRTMHPE